MKFTELLNIQIELNKKFGASPKTAEEIAWALLEECGEVSRAQRPKWRWWSWAKKAEHNDNTLEELVDLLHFLLTMVEMQNIQSLETFAAVWTMPWYTDSSLIKCLIEVLYFAHQGKALSAFAVFCHAVDAAGFTKDDLEKAFLEKTQVNQDRLETKPEPSQWKDCFEKGDYEAWLKQGSL